jgi:hypothetical protein
MIFHCESVKISETIIEPDQMDDPFDMVATLQPINQIKNHSFLLYSLYMEEDFLPRKLDEKQALRQSQHD